MLPSSKHRFVVASDSAPLIDALEPLLLAAGGRALIQRSAESALAAITDPLAPSLVFLDTDLPELNLPRTLRILRTEPYAKTFPIVLISDTAAAEWIDLLADGAIDDVIPSTTDSPLWRIRIEVLLRAWRRACELESLLASAALNSQTDPVTHIYNRPTLISLLFRETDRVQRMNTSLCLVLFDIDDFGHWNARLGTLACDSLLVAVVGRVQPLLRSYDLFARVGKDEFLLALPGCTPDNAVVLVERMQQEVFCRPFHLDGRAVRLSACFGIAASQGRSPVVVLRDAEQALRAARAIGPDSVQCSAERTESAPPGMSRSAGTGDDLLVW